MTRDFLFSTEPTCTHTHTNMYILCICVWEELLQINVILTVLTMRVGINLYRRNGSYFFERISIFYCWAHIGNSDTQNRIAVYSQS